MSRQGFANSGAAWVPIAKFLQASLPHLKFVLSNAPVIPVTLPGGKSEELPAWFNPHLDLGTALPWDAPSAVVDRAGWDASYKFLDGIIDEEAKLVGEGKIFVGGFSGDAVRGGTRAGERERRRHHRYAFSMDLSRL